MIDNPAIAIGLGMIISLILTESVGVTAGGLIVPGYIALNLHSPAMVLTTFGTSLFTLAILNLLSRYIIIYGKNCNCNKIYDKYHQIKKMGFINVYLYPGGLFEWLLLQDIYGADEFPTTIKELDILKYKPDNIINNFLLLR